MEQRVADEYCRGLRDAEVADRLNMMVWTARTHKRNIMRKWNINTTHELVLLNVAKHARPETTIKDVRIYGLTLFQTKSK